jgi:hypothetical protein
VVSPRPTLWIRLGKLGVGRGQRLLHERGAQTMFVRRGIEFVPRRKRGDHLKWICADLVEARCRSRRCAEAPFAHSRGANTYRDTYLYAWRLRLRAVKIALWNHIQERELRMTTWLFDGMALLAPLKLVMGPALTDHISRGFVASLAYFVLLNGAQAADGWLIAMLRILMVKYGVYIMVRRDAPLLGGI